MRDYAPATTAIIIMLLSTIAAKMPNFCANRPYSEQHTLDTQRRFDKKKTDTNQNVLVAKLEQQQFDGKAAQQAPQQTKRINKFNTLIRLKVRNIVCVAVSMIWKQSQVAVTLLESCHRVRNVVLILSD